MTTSASQTRVEEIISASYPSTGQLAYVAAYRASNATAANGWNATTWAWEAASFSPEEALNYWAGVAAEDPEEARSEIALALDYVGWDIHHVWRVLS